MEYSSGELLKEQKLTKYKWFNQKYFDSSHHFNAPPYGSHDTLHTELHMRIVIETSKQHCKQFYKRFHNLSNPSLFKSYPLTSFRVILHGDLSECGPEIS